MATYTETIVDSLGTLDALGYALSVQVIDHVGFTHPAIGRQYQGSGVVTSDVGLVGTLSAKATFHLAISDVMGLGGVLSHILPLTIVEHIGFTGLLSVARAMIVIEKLGLLSNLIGNDVSQLSMIETLALDDALTNFFGLGGSDSFGLSGVFTATFQFNQVVSDNLGFATSLVENSLFIRIVTETLGLEDIDIPQMIYNQVLIDCVDFSVGFVDPGTGEFTVWATNTRTNATTEYQDWGNFNSFCQIGVDYYGANSEGLWKLNAQTDDGENIVTDIKGAMLSLGGSRYTQLDGVYLGMMVDDGARDFILKLIIPAQGIGGMDKTYLYKFNPRDMRTTKINIGKGLRARYIQWELITSGPDFDLDSIEFVPVISRRRV